jgi:hypothetical protein
MRADRAENEDQVSGILLGGYVWGQHCFSNALTAQYRWCNVVAACVSKARENKDDY